MADYIKLRRRTRSLLEHLYKNWREADDNAIGAYYGAQKIQAWIRGITVRSYIKYLHRQAVEIQRRWRGHLGRAYFVKCLLKKVELLNLTLYHFRATQIQTAWRGYWVRRHVLDFYKRDKFLKALAVANSVARLKLAEYREFMDMKEEEERQAKEAAALARQLCKTHYLISTIQRPGIYNSPFREQPDVMELRLQAVETKICKRRKQKPEKPPTILPPLLPKQQGPFREPWEVQKQRYRPPRPSFRASGDYFAMEKARKQKKLDDWVALCGSERMEFRRTKPPPYTENITTRGAAFRERGHGLDSFREENPEMFVDGKFDLNFGWRQIAVFHQYEIYQKGFCDIQFP